jgi:3',5'-cyclic AMP phosphodiesterase CpdA
MTNGDNGESLTWAHVGDLHITGEDEPNYRDFLSIIEAINTHLAGQIDFCVLPGDNADDGSADQYALIRRGLERLKVPIHVIPGDHDRKPGDLRAFTDASGGTDTDTIVVATPGFRAPDRVANGSDADAVGAWPERHLLGTQLGPNRNGRHW